MDKIESIPSSASSPNLPNLPTADLVAVKLTQSFSNDWVNSSKFIRGIAETPDIFIRDTILLGYLPKPNLFITANLRYAFTNGFVKVCGSECCALLTPWEPRNPLIDSTLIKTYMVTNPTTGKLATVVRMHTFSANGICYESLLNTKYWNRLTVKAADIEDFLKGAATPPQHSLYIVPQRGVTYERGLLTLNRIMATLGDVDLADSIDTEVLNRVFYAHCADHDYLF